MKTIISGRITARDIEDAGLMAGIFPTLLLKNDVTPEPPAELCLPVDVHPICKMRERDGAIVARNYTLCNLADALIVKGKNEHLVDLARRYGLLVYEA